MDYMGIVIGLLLLLLNMKGYEFLDILESNVHKVPKTYKSVNWPNVDKVAGMLPVNWLPERKLIAKGTKANQDNEKN